MSKLEESLKELLLVLLDDKAVGKALRKCLKVGSEEAISPVAKDEDCAQRFSACETALEQCRQNAQQDSETLKQKEQEIENLTASLAERKKELEQRQTEQSQLQQKIRQLDGESKDAREQYQALKQRGCPNPQQTALLAHLRQDDAFIAQFFKATKLAGDEQAALVQLVAVLAQQENIKRLMEFYKSRCEQQQARLNANDVQVLESALAWHNANWPDKPYDFERTQVGESYNYERHMRPTGMTGEVVGAVWLPGIPRLKIKPLVATH